MSTTLAQRDLYLTALVELQRQLLAYPLEHDSYDVIVSILGIVAVSRIYVFEKEHDATGRWFLAQRAQWCIDGLDPLNGLTWQNRCLEDTFPRWSHLLRRGEIIEGIVAEFPESERRVLESLGIQAILILPLMVKGKLFGFLGFDNCREAIGWEPWAMSLLNSAAAAISLAKECQLTQQELQRKNKALEAALQFKEDMSSMIIHDLRNPIANILLSAELLKPIVLTEKKLKKVDHILTAGMRLRSLTDELLLMAKAESGKLSLNRELIDLEEMVTQVVRDFEAIAHQKNIQLRLQLSSPGTPLLLDVNLFRRVLDNLLSNALKFSPANSNITLQTSYRMQGKTLGRIRILDSGPGIPLELRQKIFNKYEVGPVQGDASQTGLGLAFCKMVIEAHDGQIVVEENQPQGSVFTVEVPATPVRSENRHPCSR